MRTAEAVAVDARDRNGQCISSHKLGLALGAFAGCWHLVWSTLVLFGWAQPVIDFIFWLHFITPPYQVGVFVLSRAVALIAVTVTLGYVFGRLIGGIWNGLHPTRNVDVGRGAEHIR